MDWAVMTWTGHSRRAEGHAPPLVRPRATVSPPPATPATAIPEGGTVLADRPADQAVSQTPWVTIVWDDPVNLMSYVAHVFVTYFGHTRATAHRLMMTVHTQGRAVVSSGSREEMERDAAAMHDYGLWATIDKDDA